MRAHAPSLALIRATYLVVAAAVVAGAASCGASRPPAPSGGGRGEESPASSDARRHEEFPGCFLPWPEGCPRGEEAPTLDRKAGRRVAADYVAAAERAWGRGETLRAGEYARAALRFEPENAAAARLLDRVRR